MRIQKETDLQRVFSEDFWPGVGGWFWWLRERPEVSARMPEATLKALADHGELGSIMAADGGNCEEVIEKFGKSGVNVDVLASQLQKEGAKSFVKSWNDLMVVINSKSSALKKTA